jgi:uncharacterized protein YabN with tetrapyrrole methylase and pyrophosphatase domain
MRAYRICERASRLTPDRPNVDASVERLDRTLGAFKQSLRAGDSTRLAEKLGDLLFTIVNLGRIVQVHPEAALTKTTDKFVAQFEPTEDIQKK